MNDLVNKHAVITGGSCGIGAAISEVLNTHGINITIMARRSSLLKKQLKKLSSAQAIACDVTNAHLVETAFKKAVQKFGPVDIMINNAGQAHSMPFHKMHIDQWQTMIKANLDSTFLCTHATYPTMRKLGWGRIINIASTAALKGYSYVSAYCSAKHAVVGMTKALALEAAKTGVTINAICPGYTDTDIMSQAIKQICKKTDRSPQQVLETFIQSNPQERLIQPTEVANTVLWLCLNESKSVTGQSIVIAGGEVM